MPYPTFGAAVHRCGVDVVDAVLQDEVKDGRGLLVGCSSEGGGAEDRSRALLAGRAELLARDHVLLRSLHPDHVEAPCSTR
jgi:hypothetical protein